MIKTHLDLRPVTAAVGAVIDGVDLRHPLEPETVGLLHQALLDHGVIFFHNQHLDNDQMHRFVSNCGTPIPEPFSGPDSQAEPVGENDLQPTKGATSVWHADT